MEISGLKADGAAERALTEVLTAAGERGLLVDAAIAASLAQARDFWRLRKSYSPAQKPEGGNIKNDVSVAIARIPEFIARADAAVQRLCPGARPVPLAHFGDGSVHYNIAQPPGMAKSEFLARWDDLTHAVQDIVIALGGSISAEHGIGEHEARRSRTREGRRRDGADAPHQGSARPQGHPQSRQGAVTAAARRRQ